MRHFSKVSYLDNLGIVVTDYLYDNAVKNRLHGGKFVAWLITIDGIEYPVPYAWAKRRESGEEFRLFELWDYDVWGNCQDGYEVNNQWKWGSLVLPVDFTYRELWSLLKFVGFLRNHVKFSNLAFGGDDMFVSVDNKSDGYPVCHINVV